MGNYYKVNDLTPIFIREYRRQNSLSPEKFARRAGVAPSTISRFEVGEGNFS